MGNLSAVTPSGADGTTGSGYLVQRDGVALIQDNGIHSSFEINLQKVPLESLD